MKKKAQFLFSLCSCFALPLASRAVEQGHLVVVTPYYAVTPLKSKVARKEFLRASLHPAPTRAWHYRPS
eukprot:scaffold115162_cov36-Tisochrysis_lutea.AAC.1